MHHPNAHECPVRHFSRAIYPKTSDSTSHVYADVAHPKQRRIHLNGHFGVGERCSVNVQGRISASEGNVGSGFTGEDLGQRVRRGWIDSQATERDCMTMVTTLFFLQPVHCQAYVSDIFRFETTRCLDRHTKCSPCYSYAILIAFCVPLCVP